MTAPLPFSRLLAVETRKLFDTRASKIMTILLVVLVPVALTARGLYAGPRLLTLVGTTGTLFGTLLPVLGILIVTGEWTRRTALTTFTLEPRRHLVLAAKWLPSLATAVAASLFAMLVAVPVTAAVAAVQDVPPAWTGGTVDLLGWTVTNVLLVAAGLAAGTLLLNAPAAIVLYLSTPALFSAIGRLGAPGETIAKWLDLNTTAAPLAKGTLTTTDTTHLCVAALAWIILPTAAGTLRVIRKEVT